MKKKTSDSFPITRVKTIHEIFTSFRKTIVWTIIILILSFLPGQAFDKVKLPDIRFQDLIVHFILYAVFTAFIITDLSGKNKPVRTAKAWWLIPLLASAILGMVTEIVQWLWITGRYGNIVDFIMNVSGSAAVILAYRIVK